MNSSFLNEVRRDFALFAETPGVNPALPSDLSGSENTPKWDELKAMALAAAIEEGVSTELATNEIMSMRSIGLVRSILENRALRLGGSQTDNPKARSADNGWLAPATIFLPQNIVEISNGKPLL